MLQKKFLQNIIKNSVSFYISKFVLISILTLNYNLKMHNYKSTLY